MEEYVIDGALKINPITKDFDISFDLLSSGLKIKGVNKLFLDSKLSSISNDNGIYILESDNSCYIGQSKDLQRRLKSHQDNNKIDFIRCFILSHNIDIRQYLDFMESYAIQKMEEEGYFLNNKTKPNPEEDKLPNIKKIAAKKWIDEFLLFLPVLGFRKSKLEKKITLTNQISQVNSLNIMFSGNQIDGKNNTEIFLNTLKIIGLEKILNQCQNLFDSSFILSDSSISMDYGHIHKFIEKNKQYYIHLNASTKTLFKKLEKIKLLMNLENLIINP
jgi:hypothetical protein